MAITLGEKKALLSNITALEELPLERISAVIGAHKPQKVSPLYRKCAPIEITKAGLIEAREIIVKMTFALKRYRAITKTGRALAANQIGIQKQVVVFLHPNGRTLHYINPKITKRSGKQNTYWEMCMSGAPLGVDVVRPETIKACWYELDGKKYEKELKDFDARRMQHEIDHLNGKVCYNTEGTIPNTLGYSLNPQEYLHQELRPHPPTLRIMK